MKFLITQYLLASYSYVHLGPKYLPHRRVLENLLYYFLVIFLILAALFGMGDTVHVQRRYMFPLHLLETDFQFFKVFFYLVYSVVPHYSAFDHSVPTQLPPPLHIHQLPLLPNKHNESPQHPHRQ
jgi:hypothetical protein